jgi:predicted nucleic acid-binding protein
MSEIEYPLKHGIKAPEVKLIKSANILTVKRLTAKEMLKAKKIAEKYRVGIGESQAAVLWMRGNFDVVIVADVRARRTLRKLNVGVMDVVDVGFELARKRVNPLQFARKLWENAHYRTERIKEILHRYR